MSGEQAVRALGGGELGEAQKVLLNPVEAQTWNGAEPANEDEFDADAAALALAAAKAGRALAHQPNETGGLIKAVAPNSGLVAAFVPKDPTASL